MKGLGIFLALLVAAPAYAADSAASVLACMRANVPQSLRVRDIELAATDKAGATRTLRGRLYAMREKRDKGEGPLRAMLRIDAPENLAGAAYLLRETDDYLNEGMYVYLPSVKRVRRVKGTFADGALLGTDFSYNDFKQIEGVFADADAILEPPAEVDQRAVYVLRLKARPGTVSRYSSVRAWIDQRACVPLKVEFYEGETARKQLSAPPGSLRQSANFWYLPVVEMRDLKEQTKTVLRVIDVNTAEFSSNYFDPKLFYLGK